MKAKEYRAIAQALYELRMKPHGGPLNEDDADKVAIKLADLFECFSFYERYSKDRFLGACGVSWHKRKEAREAREAAIVASATSVSISTPMPVTFTVSPETPQPAIVSDWIRKAFETNP